MSRADLKIHRRTFLALGTGAAATLAMPSLAFGASPVRTETGRAFGTGWQVTLPAGKDFAPLRGPVEALLADIDQQMSPWRADSDISRFNRAPSGSVGFPAPLTEVASAAMSLARASDGVFDPAVGPLVARWGFGPIAGDGHPDWRSLKVDADAVSKSHADLTLDLCGIAKGYALDRMADLLENRGHSDFLIDLGGELTVRGIHPSRRHWQAGVEDPRPEFSGLVEVLRLDGLAVATSGSRANSYVLGDRIYSHIIDPTTGEPVAGKLASVSVLAENAMTADGWATALMAAGAANGPSLARRNGVSALFLLREGEGLHRITTGAFMDYLA